MPATPEHLYELAGSMEADGAPFPAIIRSLLDAGASDLDLVRVTKKVKGVGLVGARDLIDASGVISSGPRQLTIIIPEDDPWYPLFYPNG